MSVERDDRLAWDVWDVLPRQLLSYPDTPARDAVVITRLPADAPAACYQCRGPAMFAIGYYGPTDGPVENRSPGVALNGGAFYACSLRHAWQEIEDRAEHLFPVEAFAAEAVV